MTTAVIYGQLGVLAYDEIEDKVQCHICGKWFTSVAVHVIQKHRWTADEYREEFGLNRGQALCSSSLSEKHRRHFTEQGLVGKRLRFDLSSYPHPTDVRLQARLNSSRARTGYPIRVTPKRKAAQKRNYQNSLVPLPCVECGTEVLARNIPGRAAVCPGCRKEHKRKYNQLWANQNRQHLREYWRDYDRNRRKKVHGKIMVTIGPGLTSGVSLLRFGGRE